MDSPANIQNKTKRKWYRYILNISVLFAVTYFVVINLKEISAYEYEVNWVCLIFGFFFTVAAYIISFLIWIQIAASFNLQAPFFLSGKAWFLAQLGKYVPGKVATLLVRLDAYKGYSKKKVTVATGVEVIIAFASVCLIIIISTFFSPHDVPQTIKTAVIIGTLIFLIMLYPPLIMRLANIILQLFKRDTVEEMPRYGVMLKMVLEYFIMILVNGLGVYFIYDSIKPVSFDYFMIITAVYYGASLIGLLALFAPGGIGVREGLIFIVLIEFIPKPVVIVGTIVTRLVTIIVEIVLALTFVILENKYSRRNQERQL
jgi:uncharacterized membrane protein YbhN (UPF0104 family)